MEISQSNVSLVQQKNLREIGKPDLHMSTKKLSNWQVYIHVWNFSQTFVLTHFWFCIASHVFDEMFLWHLYCFNTRTFRVHFCHKIINERCNDVRMSIFSLFYSHVFVSFLVVHRQMKSTRMMSCHNVKSSKSACSWWFKNLSSRRKRVRSYVAVGTWTKRLDFDTFLCHSREKPCSHPSHMKIHRNY